MQLGMWAEQQTTASDNPDPDGFPVDPEVEVQVDPDPDAEVETCPVCGTEIPARPGPGRPRLFCSEVCRRYTNALRSVLREKPVAAAKVAAHAVRAARDTVGRSS